MFPFVFDPRPTSSLFSNSKRLTRSSSRGTNIPSEIKDSFPAPPSSYPTATPPRYATRSSSGNSGNSLRNPYNFVQPRPSYSPSHTKKRSGSSTSSSTSSTKSRLAAINSAYDSQYGEFSGHGTAEEIRNSQQPQASSRPAPDISFTDPSVSRSRSSTSSSTTSTNSDEDSSSVKSRSLRRLVKDKTKAVLGLKRSGSTSSDNADDQDRLMEDEGR